MRRRVSRSCRRGLAVDGVLGEATEGVRKPRFIGLARQVAVCGIGYQRCASGALIAVVEPQEDAFCEFALALPWLEEKADGFALTKKRSD